MKLWDCPDPPSPHSCRYVGEEAYSDSLRTIDLRKVFGLTVFSGGGHTYGFHAHTKKCPSALETYQKIPAKKAKRLLWTFFPVSSGERISAVWVQYRPGIHSELSRPTLLVSLSTTIYILS